MATLPELAVDSLRAPLAARVSSVFNVSMVGVCQTFLGGKEEEFVEFMIEKGAEIY